MSQRTSELFNRVRHIEAYLADIFPEEYVPTRPRENNERIYVTNVVEECKDRNEWDNDENCFECPISKECLSSAEDQVVKGPSGHCYNRNSVRYLLRYTNTDPMTREDFDDDWKEQWGFEVTRNVRPRYEGDVAERVGILSNDPEIQSLTLDEVHYNDLYWVLSMLSNESYIGFPVNIDEDEVLMANITTPGVMDVDEISDTEDTIIRRLLALPDNEERRAILQTVYEKLLQKYGDYTGAEGPSGQIVDPRRFQDMVERARTYLQE